MLVVAFWCSAAADSPAHEFSNPAPIAQPSSPIQLESCYLGTNFIFGGDKKLAQEETKMQLSANLARAFPRQYRLLGLRFEFGRDTGKRSADVIAFAASDAMTSPPALDATGYLPRVGIDYEDFHCGVDFATSLDWKRAWFDAHADVTACPTNNAFQEKSAVWLTALELLPHDSLAVFLMTEEKQRGVYWSLDRGTVHYASADEFGRSVVSLGDLSSGMHTLTYRPGMDSVTQQMCFQPFSPER